MTANSGDDQTRVLLRRWHDGERQALHRLLERDLAWIRQRVEHRLGQGLRARGESQDYVQDALLEALELTPRFVVDDRDHFRRLLARIVENMLRDKNDFYRRARRDMNREQPLPSDTVVSLVNGSLASPVTDPGRRAENNEAAARLRLAMELLRPHEREVLVLRQWDGLDYRSIATRLKTTEVVVRKRFQRAIAHLANWAERLEQRSD